VSRAIRFVAALISRRQNSISSESGAGLASQFQLKLSFVIDPRPFFPCDLCPQILVPPHPLGSYYNL